MSVAALLQRLRASPTGSKLDWMAAREDVLDEFERATTSTDREALLAVYKVLVDTVERNVPPENLADFRLARTLDVRTMLVSESVIGGNVCVDLLAHVTDREIAAGRLAPDDDLRMTAILGIAAPHLSREQLIELDEQQRSVPSQAAAIEPSTSWLQDWRRRRAERKVAEDLTRNSIVKSGRAAIDRFWIGSEIVQTNLSKAVIDRIADQLLDSVIAVATSADPVKSNRERLLLMSTLAACFQVLVLAPPPAPDVTKLRGQLGITGGLKAHLASLTDEVMTLAEIDDPLPAEVPLLDVCFVRLSQSHAAMSTHHMLRYALDDSNPKPELDWFLPMFTVQCALAEWRYRDILRLPQIVDRIGCSELASLITLIRQGERWPDRAWERRYGRELPRVA